jgi:hypothetical protein
LSGTIGWIIESAIVADAAAVIVAGAAVGAVGLAEVTRSEGRDFVGGGEPLPQATGRRATNRLVARTRHRRTKVVGPPIQFREIPFVARVSLFARFAIAGGSIRQSPFFMPFF